MSVDVRFDTEALQARIRAYGTRDKNIPMALVGEMISSAVDDVIQSEGLAGTKGAWDPFLASTLQRHPRRIGGKLLQDTGVLANMQSRPRAREVKVESPAPYAGWHAEGTRAIPERDFLAIDFNKVLEDIAEVILMEMES